MDRTVQIVASISLLIIGFCEFYLSFTSKPLNPQLSHALFAALCAGQVWILRRMPK